jgi:hypothetical protein
LASSSFSPASPQAGKRAFRPNVWLVGVIAMVAVAWLLVSGDGLKHAEAVTGPCEPVLLDFSGLPKGTLLSEQYAGLGIHISAIANEGRPNQLIVFDSNASGTPDPDLEADIGNLAIIPEHLIDTSPADGLVDVPNDSIRGGKQIYTFDHERIVGTFSIVDIDHGDPDSHYAAAYDASNNLIKKVPIPIHFDTERHVETVTVNASGVRRLEIVYRDSAGVTDIDLGCPGAGQGCTPGYWKQEHHFDSWTAPYDPSDQFSDHFEDAFPGMTLLEVLEQGGGGLNALGRHTVAALLNAASPDVNFAPSPADVISAFNGVFPGTRDAYNALKDTFEDQNERGCPLD